MHKQVGRATVAVLATLAIIYLLPFPFYGTFQPLGLVELPEGGTPG